MDRAFGRPKALASVWEAAELSAESRSPGYHPIHCPFRPDVAFRKTEFRLNIWDPLLAQLETKI